MASRLVCIPRSLAPERRALAASLAADVNPDARAAEPTSVARRLVAARAGDAGGGAPSPAVIAVVARKAWGRAGVRLTTGFMDAPSAALRREILRHLNMWSERANVTFVASDVNPQVRIARFTDPEWSGYWSYLGTDILGIPDDEPTMNLEGFTTRTPASELRRVVCHEAGHTLGFPHEHMRAALVQRIDPQRAYDYFRRTDGWSPADVDDQVLTPLGDATLLGTPPDQTSIMCYQLPGSIMRNGKPILGGTRINATDHDFAAQLYPKLAPAKKTPAKKTAVKKTPGKKTAAKRTSAKRTAVKKTTATKQTTAREAPTRAAARRRGA